MLVDLLPAVKKNCFVFGFGFLNFCLLMYFVQEKIVVVVEKKKKKKKFVVVVKKKFDFDFDFYFVRKKDCLLRKRMFFAVVKGQKCYVLDPSFYLVFNLGISPTKAATSCLESKRSAKPSPNSAAASFDSQ